MGRSTLAVIAEHPERFEVEALTAHRNVAELARLARRHRARLAVVADPARLGDLREALAGSGIEAAAGDEALVEAAERPAEFVMAAIVGAAGLAPTLAAVRRGAIVALANKECLVSAGPLFMAEVRRCGATLLPVDSEHNAVFQTLPGGDASDVEKIVLTASGGPFLHATAEEMATVTPARAVAHPNWRMGAKISVDSATMMNKGLEVIEAHYLFGLPASAIEVVVHPQSAVHGLVLFRDGSMLAQLGPADMRVPIASTLAWPERMRCAVGRLDLLALGRLDFLPPDPDRFPALAMAREALAAGGAAPAVLNAANETAVQAFLEHRIGFLDIVRIVGDMLATPLVDMPAESLEDILAVDRETRRRAARACEAPKPGKLHGTPA
ncbi:MAG TPA: 1-deoxy-D-xylulose-5-phosphate reductoisomerase [Rhodospirillales bacterium]|nr:1-deoxy-D-xylulose-5-phosphate reductoisomerase [Rhodospirillales bacterium]